MKFWRLTFCIVFVFSSILSTQTQSDSPAAYGVSWSPDGHWIAANSTKGLWLFDVENPEAEPRIYFEEMMISNIEFDPTGNYLAAIIDNYENEPQFLEIIELATGEVIHQRLINEFTHYNIDDILYSADGETLLITTDSSVRVFDAEIDAELRNLDTTEEIGYNTDAWIMGISQIGETGNYAAVNWSNNFLMINDEAGLLESSLLPELELYSVYAIEHLETSNFLIHAADGMFIYNISDESLERLVAPLETRIAGYAYSPESELLLSGSMIGSNWQLYDVAAREVLFDFVLEDTELTFFGFDFNPDSSQFVSLQTDGLITIWDVETGEMLNTWDAFERAFGRNWG